MDWKPAIGNKNRERYYDIGFGHNFNPNTSFKVLYQYIVYKAGDFPAVGPPVDDPAAGARDLRPRPIVMEGAHVHFRAARLLGHIGEPSPVP